MAKRYSTVTVTPTIVKANFDNNDVMGDFTRLPLPVRDGESCLYELSCSSSTMISPKFFNGEKIALLAPITILHDPSLISLQVFAR